MQFLCEARRKLWNSFFFLCAKSYAKSHNFVGCLTWSRKSISFHTNVLFFLEIIIVNITLPGHTSVLARAVCSVHSVSPAPSSVNLQPRRLHRQNPVTCDVVILKCWARFLSARSCIQNDAFCILHRFPFQNPNDFPSFH